MNRASIEVLNHECEVLTENLKNVIVKYISEHDYSDSVVMSAIGALTKSSILGIFLADFDPISNPVSKMHWEVISDFVRNFDEDYARMIERNIILLKNKLDKNQIRGS